MPAAWVPLWRPRAVGALRGGANGDRGTFPKDRSEELKEAEEKIAALRLKLDPEADRSTKKHPKPKIESDILKPRLDVIVSYTCSLYSRGS